LSFKYLEGKREQNYKSVNPNEDHHRSDLSYTIGQFLLLEEVARRSSNYFTGNSADVNAKAGHAGRTPLDWAIKYKYPVLADLLRKHGAKTGKELKAEGK